MPRNTPLFRVFISSTFSDFVAEREVLRDHVFPRLRTLCRARGAAFQAVDLRWGISRAAAESHDTMRICLDEIDRCRAVTKNPNFLALIGDRYGWRPPPQTIAADDFDAIRAHLRAGREDGHAHVDLLDRCYLRDDNAVPPHYRLHLEGTAAPKQSAVLDDVATVLRSVALALPWSEHRRRAFIASATEQEIARRGLLDGDGTDGSALCIFRSIAGLPADARAQSYRDLRTDGTLDTEAQKRLRALKRQLRANVGRYVRTYRVQWQGKAISKSHLARLANDVYAHLARAIEVQLADLQSRDADPTIVESTAHRIFAEDRRRLFIGRTDVLRVIEDHLRRPSAHLLVVHGAAGSGKSTVMARALAVVDPAAALVYRFIGVTPASSLLPALLEGLCAELARLEGIARSGTAVADVSQLSTEFRGRLATVGAQRPLVVFLDALDQLSAAHGARALNWLPLDLPATVHFVVSAADGAVLETLMQLVPADHRCEVRPMPVSDGSALLDAWLADAKRALQPAQRAAVLRSFQVQRLPLHLRLAFEEARRWPSDHTPPRLPADVPGLVRSLFARLSLDANHGAHLVTRSVAFIVAGRYGVGEEEMLDLLSADAQVMRELRRRSPDSPRTDTMPGVVWSRLYFDLVPYLTERAAAGGTTLGFFHRQLAEVVSHDLLAGRAGKQRHSALVRYFRDQPDQRVASDAASPNLRKFDEWPFQLAYAGRWGELARLFTTFAFLRAKIESLGPLAVIEDFDVAREAGGDIPGAAAFRRGRGYLGALQDAVRLSAAVLGNDPKMLASQILGRLRGLHRELSPLVRDAERFAHRPWLNPLTASLGRPGGPLNQAIVLDRAIVAVHFVDQDHVIVGCEDGTLRLIDLQQGGERWRVPAHACDLVGLTYDQRMRRAVTIASDGSVGVWSIDVPKRELSFNVDFKPRCVGIAPGGAWMAIGGERRTAKSPYYEGIASVRSCSSGDELAQVLESHPLGTIAVTADGRSFIGGSSSGHIRQWNAAGAGLMNDFRTHDGMIGSIAIADEADRLLIGSGDQSTGQYNLRLWHLSEWRELDIFKGHRWMIHSVAITPDGRVGASAAIDTTVRIWDFEAKRQIVCFRGHARRDGALTMTPDGHRIVSSSASSLYEWAVERQVAPRSFLRHEESVTAIAASADSRYALSCSNDDVSALWNLRTCRARRLDALTGEAPSAVAMDRKGRFGLVGTKAGALLRVDLRRAVVKRAAQLDEQPTAMALTANGRVAAVGCSRGTIRLIDLDRGTELRRFGDHSDKVTGVAFAQGERRVISGSGDFFLYAWDPLTGRLLRRHSNGSGVPVLAASADGRRAVSGTHFGQLFVWDVERMRRIASFAHQTIGQNSMVVAAAITPDGRYALSGGDDLELRVWDLVCKRSIATFIVEDFSYCAAAAGNNVFVVGSRNGSVHILRIERGKSRSARGPAGEARWRASPPRLSEVVFGKSRIVGGVGRRGSGLLHLLFCRL